MGSLVKCASCSERCGSRPIGVYWRWMRADGVWKKYYHRICTGCYAAKVAPLEVTYEASENLRCPQCGIDTENDYDAIYVTSFPTGRATASADAPFCAACAVPVRVWVQEHARDITSLDGAPGPHQDAPAAATVIRDMGRIDYGAGRVR
jgi:hypothetical protein